MGRSLGPAELVTYEETALVLRPSLSFEQWEGIGHTLFRMGRGIQWWIGDWINYGENAYGEKYAQAIEVTGRECQTLMNAAWVAGAFETSRRREALSWSHHAEVASLSPDEQDEWLDKTETEVWTRNQLRLELADDKGRKSLEANGLPAGKYNVLYADPPWRYEHCKTDSRKIENQYPTLDLETICGMDVAKLAADDSVLFLWATSPKLSEAFEVIDAWKFSYRTHFVWRKDRIGMGYYVRQQHEDLLIATIGIPPVPDTADRPASVIDAPRGEHSAKPDVFYGVIEAMYPKAKRVELFARNERKGWKAWGNEV